MADRCKLTILWNSARFVWASISVQVMLLREGAWSVNTYSSNCQTADFLCCFSLTLYLLVSILSLFLSFLFSLFPSLCLPTSPVSGVLDSQCSEQWAPVVLGSLPLLNHPSCTNLHNSPSRPQPHQSYPRRMGTLSNTDTHTYKHTYSPQSQVF